MKTRNYVGILSLLFCLSFSLTLNAQENTRPLYVTVATTGWNFELDDETASPEEWEAMAKEYNEKVTMKNEFINSTATFNHMYTADNADVLLLTTYNTWADIENAQDRNEELEAAAWPDKEARKAFMDKMNRYMVHKHSDEIYVTTPGAKFPDEQKDTSRVVYIQKLYRAYPDDGSPEEYEALTLEYLQKVTHKNPHLLAFYPWQHGWGADNTEVTHLYVLESFADLGALNDAWDALEEAAWPDETERKAFLEKYDRYFSGRHGDFIYSTIPGISK